MHETKSIERAFLMGIALKGHSALWRVEDSLHELAALSIAVRDPWPEVDQWLARRIAGKEVLVEARTGAPQSGATAAAALLERHRQNPADYGLEPAAEPVLRGMGIDGFRFGADDAAEKIQRWWAQESGRQESPGADQP